MDVDAQDEELADLHVDLGPAQVDFARERDLGGNVIACFDGGGYELFEERCLACVHANGQPFYFLLLRVSPFWLLSKRIGDLSYLDALSQGM